MMENTSLRMENIAEKLGCTLGYLVNISEKSASMQDSSANKLATLDCISVKLANRQDLLENILEMTENMMAKKDCTMEK